MIILSGNCPRHHNAIMLELTDFDDSKISYLARISRGHHVDTLLFLEVNLNYKFI